MRKGCIGIPSCSDRADDHHYYNDDYNDDFYHDDDYKYKHHYKYKYLIIDCCKYEDVEDEQGGSDGNCDAQRSGVR